MKFFLGIFLLLVGVVQAQMITAKNWQNHPKILEVRAIYNAVNTLLLQKKLKLEQKKFEYCGPSFDLERIQYTNARGVVRRYVKSGGSEDSVIKLEHTFDAQGKLRFVLLTANAVNNTKLEKRFYFDAAGKQLWVDRRLKGEGWAWSEDQFTSEFEFNPKIAFAVTSPCK